MENFTLALFFGAERWCRSIDDDGGGQTGERCSRTIVNERAGVSGVNGERFLTGQPSPVNPNDGAVLNWAERQAADGRVVGGVVDLEQALPGPGSMGGRCGLVVLSAWYVNWALFQW